jgi:hypothetical protein
VGYNQTAFGPVLLLLVKSARMKIVNRPRPVLVAIHQIILVKKFSFGVKTVGD